MMQRLLIAMVLLLAPTGARAAGSCRALASPKLSELGLEDLDVRFAELETHLKKGLSVTLLSEVEAGDRRFAFGCRIFYDLWDEAYMVFPIVGAVEVKERTALVKKLAGLPKACTTVTLPWALKKGEPVDVTTRLNPVTEEQVAKTRKWLAERGIGANGAMAGRAAYAMVDLKQTQSFQRRCDVK